MSGAAIVCDGLWKRYRIYHQRSHSLKERILTRRNLYEEFWALSDVSFEVPQGSTMGIIGSNGSGKSTLLKVIARILTPDKGSVAAHGTMSSLLELGTGFHPELTGQENVYLAGSLFGQRREAVDKRYDEIVAFAGIEEFMDLPVKNYSSGMYARLAFAVAISVEPEILLIDEVLSVGDESFQMRCFERIAELRAQGRTIVLVSHSLDSVRSLCSEAIWLDHGRIKAIGGARDVVGEYLTEVHSNSAHDSGQAGARYGSGEAEITGVSFHDGNGTETGAFRTGDSLSIRVRYRAPTPLPESTCVLHILRADNLWHVFGQSTSDAEVPLVLDGEGEVELRIDVLPLLKGPYVVTAAIQDVHGGRVYDCHDRRYHFMVFENSTMHFEVGTVHLDGEWHVSSSSTVRA